MAGDYQFGTTNYMKSYTDQDVSKPGVPLPSGRTCSNGQGYAGITALNMWVAGNGGTRDGRLVLGNAATDTFSVGASTQAQPTGWRGTNLWIMQGGTATVSIIEFGQKFFGHNGTFYSNATMLAGSYRWVEAPAAPAMVSAEPGLGGSVTVKFNGSGDTGGLGITGWSLRYADNPSMTNPTVVDSTGTSVLYLTPGKTYWFSAAGRNSLTDWVGTTGPYSGTISATMVGVPSAPRSLTATASTNVFNRIDLAWTAPADTVGTITGYSIYRDGAKIGTTTGTGTTYAATGLTQGTSYSFTVRARNAYADSNNTSSVDSNAATAVAPGPPSAPRNLTAVADGVNGGRIDLSWTIPLTTGTGGITRYSVYQSTGALIAGSVTQTTLTVTGLQPGVSYGFYVVAWNAIADAANTSGPASATATATALGAPPAPNSVALTSSSVVAGRLTLTWAQGGTYTKFSIFEVINNLGVLVKETTALTYVMDNLSNSPHTYYVRAYNVVGAGPDSARVTATPGTSTSQALPNLAIVDDTNALFAGTHTILSVKSTEISYTQSGADVASSATAGSLTNTTNTAIAGARTIASIPTTTTLTFAATGGSTPNTVEVSGGLLTNTTSSVFNGTHTVTAVNGASHTVSFSQTHANIASAPATGAIANMTNAVFNGSGLLITGVTRNTIQYETVAANVAPLIATGTVTNTTNFDLYNGMFTVITTPTYNTFTYDIESSGSAVSRAAAVIPAPFGDTYRRTSQASLKVKYRSGWAG